MVPECKRQEQKTQKNIKESINAAIHQTKKTQKKDNIKKVELYDQLHVDHRAQKDWDRKKKKGSMKKSKSMIIHT